MKGSKKDKLNRVLINIIKFIIFLVYIIGIFFVSNYYILAAVFLINILLMLIVELKYKKAIFKKAMISLLKLLPFILFTALINYLFADFISTILITIRLILVCNISYIFSKTMTYLEFSEMIEKIFYPLKIFKINPKDVSLIVTIALSFMPILKDELLQTKNILKVKGIKLTKINLIKNINLIFKPFFVSVLQRINEIEMSLKEKGYQT